MAWSQWHGVGKITSTRGQTALFGCVWIKLQIDSWMPSQRNQQQAASQWATLGWEHGWLHGHHSDYSGVRWLPQSQKLWGQGDPHWYIGACTSHICTHQGLFCSGNLWASQLCPPIPPLSPRRKQKWQLPKWWSKLSTLTCLFFFQSFFLLFNC